MPANSIIVGDPNNPSVLLLSFGKDPCFDDITKHLMNGLKRRAAFHEATTAEEFTSLIATVTPTAIVVTEAEIAKHKYSSIRAKVVDYAKTGGIVVFCGMFSSMIRPLKLNDMWLSDWNLSWKSGDYHRTTFRLNPSRTQKLRSITSMPKRYSMKAVHLDGATSEAMVYVTTTDWNMKQSPVLFTPIRQGYVGYLGDVNAEEDSTAVVLGMCGLLH